MLNKKYYRVQSYTTFRELANAFLKIKLNDSTGRTCTRPMQNWLSQERERPILFPLCPAGSRRRPIRSGVTKTVIAGPDRQSLLCGGADPVESREKTS